MHNEIDLPQTVHLLNSTSFLAVENVVSLATVDACTANTLCAALEIFETFDEVSQLRFYQQKGSLLLLTKVLASREHLASSYLGTSEMYSSSSSSRVNFVSALFA